MNQNLDPGLEAHTRRNDTASIVVFRGDLDLASVETFTTVVDRTIAEQPSGIELDLSGLDFIDSSGVGAYVSAFRRARNKGIKLWIGGRSPQVDRVLELSGVENALAVEAES